MCHDHLEEERNELQIRVFSHVWQAAHPCFLQTKALDHDPENTLDTFPLILPFFRDFAWTLFTRGNIIGNFVLVEGIRIFIAKIRIIPVKIPYTDLGMRFNDLVEYRYERNRIMCICRSNLDF